MDREEELENEIGDLRELLAIAYIKLSGKRIHASDCATSDAPAYTPKECDCTYGENTEEIPEFEGTREALNGINMTNDEMLKATSGFDTDVNDEEILKKAHQDIVDKIKDEEEKEEKQDNSQFGVGA